jgi:hypothetical protein
LTKTAKYTIVTHNGKTMDYDYTINERQNKYRKRMYKAGFKEVRFWVKRKEEKIPGKISTAKFIRQIKMLTVGMDEILKTRLFNQILKIIKGKKEEVKMKK